MASAVLLNPPIVPAVRIITGITQSFPATVTTSFPHGYGAGMIARLRVPITNGMSQANLLQGTLLSVTDTTFTIDIDTTNFDAFYLAEYPQYQDPQVVPVGEVNDTLLFAKRNALV